MFEYFAANFTLDIYFYITSLYNFSAIVFLHQLYLYLNYFQKSLSVYSILTYLFGNSCVQIFFSDFSKGFGMLDYHILINELHLLVWNLCYLIGLSHSFLTNRTQAVCIGNTLSERKHTHGDIPQGTKMGVPLFSI